ncbi:MAG: ATP-binding protein, partial [Bacteroidia bacterium]|nr:ATP-binding protein [Bacteroidia bacterium]
MEITKGQSPFYPGQPVPLELFTGRQNEILRIERALNQVALGKPQSIFLTGEYGIGKSSLAGVMRHVAEKNYNLFAMQVMLGEATTIDELSEKTIESVLNSEFYEHSWTEKIRTFLAKYIGEQSIFGITLKLDELKKDAPNLSRGFLPFFRKILKEFSGNKVKGIFLVFDELNGITKNPQFAYFIKNLIDENALSRQPVPILIMLCSVPERRKEMIKHHQPIDRIFEIIKIEPFNDDETKKFFLRAFDKVNYSITENAFDWLCKSC